MLDRVLADIPNQSVGTLVDGMGRGEEEKYSYQHYYGTQKRLVFTPSYSYLYSFKLRGLDYPEGDQSTSVILTHFYGEMSNQVQCNCVKTQELGTPMNFIILMFYLSIFTTMPQVATYAHPQLPT